MLQRVGRIIRRANHRHPILFEDGMHGHFGQPGVGCIPNLLRGGFVQKLGDAEEPFQFEVGPVVERIAQRVRHGAGKGEEFIPVARVPRAVFLGHAVGSHRAPFVVVAGQPDLVQVAKRLVGRDLVRRQVTMVIENRFVLGVFEIQFPRHVAVQQKIIGEKRFRAGGTGCRP